MNAIATIVQAEFQRSIRNRWALASVILLASLAFSLVVLGSTPIGDSRASLMSITTVSLSSLSLYLIPLVALTISFDAIVGEQEQGTLLLLLTYPISRWQIILGKFLGHLAVLLLAILLGYGSAGLYLVRLESSTISDWISYAQMMGSSLLLGAVFISLGCLISLLSKVRASAIGAAVGAWLFLLVLYDLILLGLILADKEQQLLPIVFDALVLINPADAYRLYNLAGSEAASMVSGVASLTDSVSANGLLGLMCIWIVLLLSSAMYLFSRKEL
ncbi:MAG: ABC transporter permease [Pseudomonadales bacterium]|nr:ABC transporter permease [Pseudomonadales bacterium]